MKSSVIGACTCLVLSIDLFTSRRSKQARMSLGFFGLGCTTKGEHHVIASCAGTCSMMSFCSNSSSRFWRGSVNRYGTLLGFWAIGVALSFIGTDICISWPSRIARPIPVNRSLYLSSIASSSALFSFFFDVQIFLMCLSGLLSPSVASISTIPRSSSVCLSITGGESIFPLMMTIVVLIVCVWFEINTSASPITGRSSLKAFNLIADRLSVTLGAFSCSFLNWCSSIMLVSEPVSGSTCVSFPLIFTVHVFSWLVFFWLV